MDRSEIILNLWYVYDDLGVIYSLRARAYLGQGSDKDKLALLQSFALTDYLIARPFPIPSRFHIEGRAIFHKAALDMLDNQVDLFKEAIDTLQSELPSQTPLDIPQKPLVCITPLFGDDNFNIRPMFSGQEKIK